MDTFSYFNYISFVFYRDESCSFEKYSSFQTLHKWIFSKSNIYLAIVLSNEKQRYTKNHTFKVRKRRRSVGNLSTFKWYREPCNNQMLVHNNP